MENMLDRIKMQGKSVIIVGGHSGIGNGVAHVYAQAGADIVIVGRRKERGEKAAAELVETYGVKADFICADITRMEDIERLTRETLDKYGKIDILIDCAGTTINKPAEDYTYEDWHAVMDINLEAMFFLNQYIGRVMLEQGYGSIVNITSNSDRVVQTPQKQVAYNVSKGGAQMLTKVLAFEWAKRGVRVNAIAPGYTETEILPVGTAEDGRSYHDVWMSMMPLGRFAKTEEIGALALFLGSEMSSFITGETVVIDGGYTLI